MKKCSKQKGFTLVELLIVIIVIGILTAMMILSSTESVTTAKAIKIISDLSLLKRAVNAWYLDNYTRLNKTDNGYYVDATYNASSKKYTGGTRLHDYLNEHSEEIAKYFSNAGASFKGTRKQGSILCCYWKLCCIFWVQQHYMLRALQNLGSQ